MLMSHFAFTWDLSMRRVAALALLAACAAASAAGAADAPRDAVEAVQAAARRSLAEQADRAGLVEAQFEVVVVKPYPPLAACAQPVAVDEVDARAPSRMRFSATCPGADGWKRELVARATVTAKVVVAAVDVPANKPLQPEDVTVDRRDVTATRDTLADAAAVEGLSSRRTLRAGEVLRKTFLVAPTLVKRGDAVRIVAHQGNIEVTVPGEALDTGAQGDTVRVRNVTTGTVIRARVIAAGAVEPADAVRPMPDHSRD
jgi:flagella basal body P-ring formation protein FlgA